jgi:hypothetical protein
METFQPRLAGGEARAITRRADALFDHRHGAVVAFRQHAVVRSAAARDSGRTVREVALPRIFELFEDRMAVIQEPERASWPIGRSTIAPSFLAGAATRRSSRACARRAR